MKSPRTTSTFRHSCAAKPKKPNRPLTLVGTALLCPLFGVPRDPRAYLCFGSLHGRLPGLGPSPTRIKLLRRSRYPPNGNFRGLLLDGHPSRGTIATKTPGHVR